MAAKFPKINLATAMTPEEFTRLKQDMAQTWQAIGADCEEFVEDNEGAVEMVIDANRLSTFASKESDELISKLCEKYGYSQIHAVLSRNVTIY